MDLKQVNINNLIELPEEMLTIEYIQEYILKCHNILLLKPSEQPNENIIYHIYSDGEITDEKGGWAFSNRSMRTLKDSIVPNNYVALFPVRRGYNDSYGCAMVTLEDALKIRELLSKYHSFNK